MLLRKSQGLRAPGLAVILIGDDPASSVYVNSKKRACEQAGLVSKSWHWPSTATQPELLDLIKQLNEDASIDGILVQLPLPDGLNEAEVLLAIDPDKDVDGFHPSNVGKLQQNRPALVPCTPAGVMEMLRREGIDPKGHVWGIGHSNDIASRLEVEGSHSVIVPP